MTEVTIALVGLALGLELLWLTTRVEQALEALRETVKARPQALSTLIQSGEGRALLKERLAQRLQDRMSRS